MKEYDIRVDFVSAVKNDVWLFVLSETDCFCFTVTLLCSLSFKGAIYR